MCRAYDTLDAPVPQGRERINVPMNSIMPLLSRFVITAAMVTTGWVNCFVFVEVTSIQATQLQELDINVRDAEVVEEGALNSQTTRGLHRIVLVLHHSWPQLGGWGKLLAWSVGVCELLAGVLLFVGLFTRMSAFVICIIMGMALYLVSHKINGMFTMSPFEWPLHQDAFSKLFTEISLFVMSLGLVCTGAGVISIDYFQAASRKEVKISSDKPTKKGDV